MFFFFASCPFVILWRQKANLSADSAQKGFAKRAWNADAKRFSWRAKNPVIQRVRRLDFWLTSSSFTDT